MPGGPGLLETSSGLTCVSAIKRHETRDTLVVRLYNIAGEPVEETLRLGTAACAAWRTNLLEERVGKLECGDGHSVPVPLRPHEIATVEIEFGPAAP